MSQFNELRNSTTPDQIYFDVIATNFQDTNSPPPQFYYNERREVPFIEKPEDYYLTIDRFTCETNSLPVFIPTIMSAQEQTGSSNPSDWTYCDPNLTIYRVVIQLVDRSVDPPQYGDYYSVPVYWKPQDQSIPPPAFLNSGTQNNTTGYYHCYSFSYLTYLIQEALNTAFIHLDATLSANSVTNPASIPPIFSWDSQLQKAVFTVETAGYVMGGATSPSTDTTGIDGGGTLSGGLFVQNYSVANSDIVGQRTAADMSVTGTQAMTDAIARANGRIPMIGGGWNSFWNGVGGYFKKAANNFKTAAVSLGNGVAKLVTGHPGGAVTDFGKTVVASSGILPNPVTQIVGSTIGHFIEARGESMQDSGFTNTTSGSGSQQPRQLRGVINLPSPAPVAPKFNYAGTNRVLEVSFNSSLFQLFNSFPAFCSGINTQLGWGGKDYRLIFPNMNGVDEGTITPMYSKNTLTPIHITKITQEYSTVASLSPITSVVFCSNTLPIVPNLVSTPLIYKDGVQVSKTGVDAAFANIITDLASEDGNYRPYLVYLPTAQYRYITLRGNQPLYNLDLTIFYRTKFGELIPFLLSSGASVTIKIAFIKKSSLGLTLTQKV